jgi:hypothetical protein
MRSFNLYRAFLALLTLAICGGVTLLVLLPTKSKPVEQPATDQEKNKVARELEELHQKYARIRSVHILATVKISLYDGGLREGSGSFEYWADDNRYRIACHTDPQLELVGDLDEAYNGGRFYYLDRKTGMLSHSAQEGERSLSALPNPFFLPVDFFSNDADECVFCRLRLKDFKARSTRWDKQKDKISIRSKGKDRLTSLDFTELEIPGEIIDRRNSKFRLHVTDSGNGVSRPDKIERLQANDRPLTSIVLNDYTSTVAGEFPRRIQVQTFDDQSTVVLRVDYYIEKLELNQAIDQNVFTISNDEAEGVWDSDEKKFIKEKPLKRKPQ